MMNLPIDRVEAGMVSAVDLRNPRDPTCPILVVRGVPLTAPMIRSLREHFEVASVWVANDDLQVVDELMERALVEGIPQVQARLLATVRASFADAQEPICSRRAVAEYRSAVSEMCRRLIAERGAMAMFQSMSLSPSLEDEAFQRCYLSMAVGIEALEQVETERIERMRAPGARDRRRASELTPLGLGAILFDADPSGVARTVEDAIVHAMLRERGHEDGTHPFTRIANLAQGYILKTSRQGKPPVQALREIAGEPFDPDFRRAFLRIVMPFPIGRAVTLEDGRDGVVIDFDASKPCAPPVRVVGGDRRFEDVRTDAEGSRIVAFEGRGCAEYRY